MFLEFLVVSFFDITTFCIFSIIHWYPSIQKFVQPTGWMLVWRSSTWQFDLSTWLKDHGRRHWSCCFGREPTWGLAKILLTFALKILWNLKSSNQSMLMKFGTQVVAGEYIQRLCEVPQDTNQTTFWHQRFSKKTDDSTGHGNPEFHHLDLFWSLSWTGFNAQENMDDDYFAQGATLWVWFGWDLMRFDLFSDEVLPLPEVCSLCFCHFSKFQSDVFDSPDMFHESNEHCFAAEKCRPS